MLRYQFLLTWIVLLGAIGVYSQFQQNTTLDFIDEQGQYEVHKRVTRGDRNQQTKQQNSDVYNKRRQPPPPAHLASTSNQASFRTNPSSGSTQRQGQNQPSPAHRSSMAEQGTRNVALTQKKMEQGSREHEIIKMSKNGFLPLQEKLKDQRDKAASNRYESVIKYAP